MTNLEYIQKKNKRNERNSIREMDQRLNKKISYERKLRLELLDVPSWCAVQRRLLFDYFSFGTRKTRRRLRGNNEIQSNV